MIGVNNKFQELTGILGRQHDILLQIETVLERKRQALCGFNRDDLDRATNTLETLALQMNILEQARRRTTAEIARRHAVAEESAGLSWLVSIAPDDQKSDLDELRDLLRDTSGRVRLLQDRNRVLLINGAQVVHGLIENVETTVNPRVTYSDRAKMSKNRRTSATFRRV